MAHGMRLHKRAFGDVVEKRSPHPTPAPAPVPDPDPQLLGNLVGGIGSIANEAVDGVVGLVTTALSDVNALLSPARASPAPPPAPPPPAPPPAPSTPPLSVPPPSTNPPPNPVSTPPSTPPTSGGDNSGGNNSGGNNSGASNGSTGSGQNSGGSNSNGNPASAPNSGPSRETESLGNVAPPNDNPAATRTSPVPADVDDTDEVDTGIQVTGASREANPSVSLSRSGAFSSATGTESAPGPRVTVVPVINAVSSADSADPSAGTALSGARNTGTVGDSLHSPSSTGSPGTGPNSGGDGDMNEQGASSANLSPGIIAAIVIGVVLVLIALVIFVVRRWHRKRRERRFTTWMARPGPFTFLGAASVSINNEKSEASDGAGSGTGTRSARSSFGTTFDHGLRPFTPEVFQPSTTSFSFYSTVNTSMSLHTPSRAASIMTPTVQRPENAVSRQSLISLESSSSNLHGGREVNTSTEAVVADRDDTSDGHGQYVFLPAAQSQDPRIGVPQASPISVRPWSPSERWAFPIPPAVSTTNDIFYQPPASHPIQAERVPASQLPSLSPVTSREATDPFADSSQVSIDTRRESLRSAATEGAVTAKTSASTASDPDGIVGTVEYVRRPFAPTLADELGVECGDVIRVLQVFDDGWVYIEKISSADPNADANANEANQSSSSAATNERGLIPMDCLRESGEPLPSFLASRRVSSYYGQGVAI